MSKVYLPRADQFDLMNENLARIANAISSDIDISTWEGIQRAVRLGVAPGLLPIGTQLIVPHTTYGDMVYDVVAHNHFKSAKDENAPTMTLMSHNTIESTCQFDSREAFYYADAELPAGTYNFTIPESFGQWAAGTYKFTLAKALPKGGQLHISDSARNISLTNLTVVAYENRTTTTSMSTSAISSGTGGTNLGSFGVELNHVSRVSYGSNNYKESAIRQFLNSSAGAGSVWVPQTKYDRPPAWVTSLAGFEKGLDANFLSIIGEVIAPCVTNNVYESPDSETSKDGAYTLRDKFYLPSSKEILGAVSHAGRPLSAKDESIQFPYYKDTTGVDRIKYDDDGRAVIWQTRFPDVSSSSRLAYFGESGNPAIYDAYFELGAAIVCTIV